MRKTLEYAPVCDLALLEANRVLRPRGSLLVGLTAEGGRSAGDSLRSRLKHIAKKLLEGVGFARFEDFYTCHRTYQNLMKIIPDDGFNVADVYWQPD
jgi:ubiquinone/menaquinone biosynthesis C-methylase UbiE